MPHHLHGAALEVLHGEAGWNRGAVENAIHGIRFRFASGAEVHVRDPAWRHGGMYSDANTVRISAGTGWCGNSGVGSLRS